MEDIDNPLRGIELSEAENSASFRSDAKGERTTSISLIGEVSAFALNDPIQLKEILGRKTEKVSMILAAILAKPNQSPYDTLIIDIGTKEGIKTGSIVFALGNLPIGRVSLVYANSAKVTLFSSPGEQMAVIVSGNGAVMNLVGRGGGNFEMIIPTGFNLLKGNEVVLPGITPYVIGIVQTILSDPRDSLQKALLTSPVNVQELKFVEVQQ